MQRAWGNLLHTVRTGETAFDFAFGIPAFTYLERNPEASSIYNTFMATRPRSSASPIVSVFDFSSFETIVDVGGGSGSLLVSILREYPEKPGIVFDLPHARGDAETALQEANLLDRARFEGGDFFAAVPPGADCYLLRQVIHDWDDEHAEIILRSCRKAIKPNGRLLLLEMIMPAVGDAGIDTVMIDVTMLARVGGRERTEAEYRALVARAGFQLETVTPAHTAINILECVPT
jgi:trans-aconitate methyltransferase